VDATVYVIWCFYSKVQLSVYFIQPVAIKTDGGVEV